MGLIYNDIVKEDCRLGIWEIQEGYDELFHSLNLDGEQKNRLYSFKNLARRVEWLSVRRLLKEMLGREEKIVYDENKKPFLKNNSYQISISHSYHYTSILLSKQNKVGIDLEYMSHRISSISHKFINDAESIIDDPELKRYHLYVHWCAKEALYKICDKQDINFKTNLTILPFEPRNEGEIKGILSNRYGTERFNLSYFRKDGYVVVWVVKDKPSLEKLFNFTNNEINI